MNASEPPAPETPAKPKPPYRLGCLIALLGLVLLFIALPGIIRSRGGFVGTNSCISNLKHIDNAVQQWVRSHKKAATDTYSLSDPQILRHLRGSVLPACPGGGRYSPGTSVSDNPRCSFASSGHTL